MKVKEGDIVAFYLNSSYTLLFECEECGLVSKGLMQQLVVSVVAGSVVTQWSGRSSQGCRLAIRL